MFGFEETFRIPVSGIPDHIKIRKVDLTLVFAVFTASRKYHGLAPKEGFAKSELMLWTNDVDSAYDFLISKGVKPVSPPHDFIGTLRAVWIFDLDGNDIQLVSRM